MKISHITFYLALIAVSLGFWHKLDSDRKLFAQMEEELSLSIKESSTLIQNSKQRREKHQARLNSLKKKSHELKDKSPNNIAARQIEDCLRIGKCIFQLRGEATPQPKMSFIVLDEIYNSFGTIHYNIVRSKLRSEIFKAQRSPENYANTPKSAPYYQTALKNIRSTSDYSIIISRGLSQTGSLNISEEIKYNF